MTADFAKQSLATHSFISYATLRRQFVDMGNTNMRQKSTLLIDEVTSPFSRDTSLTP